MLGRRVVFILSYCETLCCRMIYFILQRNDCWIFLFHIFKPFFISYRSSNLKSVRTICTSRFFSKFKSCSRCSIILNFYWFLEHFYEEFLDSIFVLLCHFISFISRTVRNDSNILIFLNRNASLLFVILKSEVIIHSGFYFIILRNYSNLVME